MADVPTAEEIEGIAARIASNLAANHQLRATARGFARANMRRAGVLPEYTPPALSQDLDEQLSALGFGLLQTGIEARAARKRVAGSDAVLPDIQINLAFEVAGECFEATVRNGDSEAEGRGFLQVLAGCAYHLGGFSARAYSVLRKAYDSDDRHSTRLEEVLRNLILRRLDEVETAIHVALGDEARSDEALIARLQNAEDELDEAGLLHLAMQENYFRSVATFLYAVRMGRESDVADALTALTNGEAFCLNAGFVSDWWINRVTRHLLDDLWSHSLPALLPKEPDENSGWNGLRIRFMAVLASRKIGEIELWPSQVGLVGRLMDENDDLVASLPTSSGKTRIAELCILRCLANDRRVIFVTPLRSLSAQTERTLRRTFRPLGYEISSLYGSAGTSAGDVDSLGNRPVVVCTPEKLDFALRNDATLLEDVGLVVFDEGHMLGPNERGLRYEVLVQRLLRRPDQAGRRVVCLSAMLPNGEQEDDFVAWLRSGAEGSPIKNSWRPTRLRYGAVRFEHVRNSFRYEVTVDEETSFVLDYVVPHHWQGAKGADYVFPDSPTELALATALRLAREGQTVLIYCPEKRSVRALAKTFQRLQKNKIIEGLEIDGARLKNILHIGEEWLLENDPVLACLRSGIAIHHASLPRPFLREMDSLLADGVLKITIASPTLAQGLNLSASCLLFAGFDRFDFTKGKRQLLRSEEVANVAGRAGRAFVDSDGQVIGICPDKMAEKQWNKLKASIKDRELESGLLSLLMDLAKKLTAEFDDADEVAEYLLNQQDFWADPPGNLPEVESWKAGVALLDSSLLSLIGEIESDEDEVAQALNNMLQDSLLMRRLTRHDNESRERILAMLHSRASFIWRHSTASQRKGYFFAGVGFDTGKALDAAAPQLNASIVAAEMALEIGELQTATKALREFGEVIFKIEPFVPDSLPDNWGELLGAWLAGQPMAVICAINKDATDVVEGAFVYRLTWALESIRVRSRANEEGIFGDEPLRSSAALEAGSISVQVALLIQAGLASRTAAQIALDQFPGDFTGFEGMRGWLDNPALVAMAADTWPTESTAHVWNDFISQQRTSAIVYWRRIRLVRPAHLGALNVEPEERGWVRPTNDPNIAEFLRPDLTSCGYVDFVFPDAGPRWARAVATSSEEVRIHYVGPWQKQDPI